VLAVVFPSARSVLQESQDIELDATFKAVRPYVLWVPLAIIAKESFPIAFVMALTERRGLSKVFADFVYQLEISGFTEKLMLSEEGAALYASASGINATHFLCYRDILEGFGSRTFLARIAHALLYSATKEEYERRVLRVYLLMDHFKSIRRVTETAVGKFSDLFGEDPSTSADRLEPQALWTSNQLGVATCSNHAEGLHRELNAARAGSGSPSSRLATVDKTREKRFMNAGKFEARQARKKFRQIAGFCGEEI
jgi:hypothetical protein